MSFLVISGLTKSFGQHVAVAALDLAVERGEFMALLGPSGCGKTTTLQMIAGFVTPDRAPTPAGGGAPGGRNSDPGRVCPRVQELCVVSSHDGRRQRGVRPRDAAP